MKNYQMELCGVQRTLPFIPISDDMAFASFVVLGDTELVSACAPVLAEKIGPVDAVVTAEAKGIALAYEISRLLGLKEFIVARKSQKSYMRDVVSASVHSITTAGEQHLYLDGVDADKIRGKHVCLLDGRDLDRRIAARAGSACQKRGRPGRQAGRPAGRGRRRRPRRHPLPAEAPSVQKDRRRRV